jgi:hypothetical protein
VLLDLVKNDFYILNIGMDAAIKAAQGNTNKAIRANMYEYVTKEHAICRASAITSD